MDAFKGAGKLDALIELGFARQYFAMAGEATLERLMGASAAPGATVLLCGARGVGKTQLAAWLALRLGCLAACAERAHSQIYTPLGALLDQERERYRAATPGKSVIEKAREAGVLVLDELQDGIDTSTKDWDRRTLASIVDHRYGHYRPTILVCNLGTDQLQAVLGASVVSRVNECGAFLDCNWEPFR
jgi:DNA replication protein DnaC